MALYSFKLAKLTITAFEDENRTARLKPKDFLEDRTAFGDPYSTFEVQYNPETLSMKYGTKFAGRKGIATGINRAVFNRTRPTELKVALVFDGTYVDYYGAELLVQWARGRADTVAVRIKKFLERCYKVVPKTHESTFLTLKWGKGVFATEGFKCRLESVEIKYTAFNRDGSPLRAELACVFVEAVSSVEKKKLDRLSSPDLSHRRVVRAGDTLPLLCREIYGSVGHYLRVAEVNGLDDFRLLTPGSELIFPPFERAGE